MHQLIEQTVFVRPSVRLAKAKLKQVTHPYKSEILSKWNFLGADPSVVFQACLHFYQRGRSTHSVLFGKIDIERR